MLNKFKDFLKFFKSRGIAFHNALFSQIFYKFNFFIFSINIHSIDEIDLIPNKCKIIIIDEYQDNNENIKYFFICFEYKMLIFKEEQNDEFSILQNILYKNNKSNVFYLKNNSISLKNSNGIDYIFKEEINKFSTDFAIKNDDFQHIWKAIVPCLSGFLIKKSYFDFRIQYDQKSNKKFQCFEKIDKTNMQYIILRQLGRGSSGRVYLIYYIQTESLYALKVPYQNTIEKIEKELSNYLDIQHPFIARYFGYFKGNGEKYLLIEFIEGRTLEKYDTTQLNKNEKYIIIFELMLTIQYLHSKEYICRDMYPENIMINQNKDAVLIDLDRLIKINDQKTVDFCRFIRPPELDQGKLLTYKSDIFILGYIMYFILFDKSNKSHNINDMIIEIQKHSNLKERSILIECLNNEPIKRPNISDIIYTFYHNFISKIQYDENKQKIFILFKDIVKNIKTKDVTYEHFIQGDDIENYSPDDLYDIGSMYYNGKYVPKDDKKAFYYFSLAAKRNHLNSLFNIGAYYAKGDCVQQNLNEAIRYLSCAADQNHVMSQNLLGHILVEIDINKAIYYLTLAANQNHLESLYALGSIYSENHYIKCDINKTIHYFTLAANQNHVLAQFKLGVIYYEGKFTQRKMNKAIHYFSLAANQYFLDAFYMLGSIYFDNIDIKSDIEKSIYYFTFAANYNHLLSQFGLGYIYFIDKIFHDIKKAIYYLTLAADKNHLDAQFILGSIYSEKKKSIL